MTSRRELLLAGPSLLRAAAPRMNFIVILADDLGYGDLGCYGSKTNRTPHLDRLAADGVRFTDHYSCSPVCSPARAGLLTGLVPDRTGVTGVLRDRDDATGLSLSLPTMADEFRRQGWRTALIGKWHLGMTERYWPGRRGFDYFWGFLSGTLDYFTHESRGGGGTGRPVTYENDKPIRLEGYYPDRMAERAVRYVEENRSSPYFLMLTSPLPHTPLAATDRWIAPFRDRLDKTGATYAGMVACLDDTVGQVRAALERTGQWDRTVIVFLSDNGWVKKVTPQVALAGSNHPFRGGKYELLEGGIRSPGIVRWPGVTRPGTVCREVS
jgi:arylsulfatase A-like enzyme